MLIAIKYIYIIYISKKLTNHNIGLFKILERKDQNAYILRLL